MFVYLKYSKQGYEITVVGESENTARYAGINVEAALPCAPWLISGAICGLAGFIAVAGSDQTISTTIGRRPRASPPSSWPGWLKFNTFCDDR